MAGYYQCRNHRIGVFVLIFRSQGSKKKLRFVNFDWARLLLPIMMALWTGAARIIHGTSVT